MIYVDNDPTYSQRVFIPRNEELVSGVTGHTFSLQRKDYEIHENGITRIHPDAGFDGISGGTIGVYVSAATGVTFEHLDVTEDGIYVPSGDSVYTGVTVQVYDAAYQNGFNDGYSSGYTVGFDAGYSSGMTDGYSSGRTDGYNEGYSSGHKDGFNEGFSSGSTSGFEEGYSSGMTDGYSSGYTAGYTAGYASGQTDGYNSGYSSGMTDGYSSGYTDGVASVKLTTVETGINENGEYNFTPPTGYNGFESVKVNVTVPGSARLVNGYTANLNNHTYTPPQGYDGFASFTVDVPETGSTAVLVPLTASTNDTYYPSAYSADGFSEVSVHVDTQPAYDQGFQDGYSSGMTEGEAAQKALLTSTTINTNGVYTNNNGWSAVTVNVPTTGHSDEELSDAFENGYNIGATSCGVCQIITNPTTLTIEHDDLTSHVVRVYNTGEPFRVFSNPAWCTVSTTDDKLFITATENTASTRAGSITLEADCVDCWWDEAMQEDVCTTSTTQQTLTIIQKGQTSDYSGEYLTFIITVGGNIKWGVTTANTTSRTIEYSINDGAWTSIDASANSSFNVSTGDVVRFKGVNEDYGYNADTGKYCTFSGSTAEFILVGNIMSLNYGDNFASTSPMVTLGDFPGLFKSCYVIDASGLVLPDMSLRFMCYAFMFRDCVKLVAPPKLPATTLANYCYAAMFAGCSSLKYAPELPATELLQLCYGTMFHSCVSLTESPVLPAPVLVTECYQAMFKGCSNLTKITCLATSKHSTSSTNALSEWVDGVSPFGTFIKNSNATFWTTGVHGIPTNWTVVNN